MENLSQAEYLELFDLTKQWCHNCDGDKAVIIQGKMGKILKCPSDKALRELDRKHPEIYEEITRPVKEDLARIFPQCFPEYVK